MKIKRNIFLWIILISLTGCSVEYKLDIDDEIREVVEINNINSESSLFKNFNGLLPIDYQADDFSVFQERIDGVEYYDVETSTKNNDKMIFSHNFQIKNKDNNIIKYDDSMIVKTCFKYVTAMNNTDEENDINELILSTSHGFLCYNNYEELEDVTIIINSKYKLIETNADTIDGHKYIWNIDKNNASDKYIYLSLNMKEKDLTFWEKILEGEYTNIFTISILLSIIALLIYLFLKKKSQSRDKI